MTTMAWPMTPTPAPLQEPFPWLVLDIETAAEIRPEEIHRWTRMVFSPSDAWKDETVGRRFREAVAAWKEKAALLDSSPIVVVAIKTPSECRLLHTLHSHAPRAEAGALVESFGTEGDMMRALAGLLETRTDPSTILAGHNIVHFDLPKLRRSMLANGVPLPAILAAKSVETFDTMTEWSRRFSLSGNAFVSLDVVLQSLGLGSHKGDCDGSKVGELIAAGEFSTLIKYSLLDVSAECDAFLRMTGRA